MSATCHDARHRAASTPARRQATAFAAVLTAATVLPLAGMLHAMPLEPPSAEADGQSEVSRTGAAEPFDVTSIAAFLRSAPEPAPAKVAKERKARSTFALTTLDADGVAVRSPVAEQAPSAARPAAAIDPPNASLAFATVLGQIKTAAHAGVMNDQPAAALAIGLTRGPVAIDASGMSEMTNLMEPGGFRKTFKLSTRASIAFN